MKPSLEKMRMQGEISALDENFARSMARLAGEERPEAVLAAALASRQLRAGHVGWDLPAWSDEREAAAEEPLFEWPETESWLAALADSPLVECVSAGPQAPSSGETPRPLATVFHAECTAQSIFAHDAYKSTFIKWLLGNRS